MGAAGQRDGAEHDLILDTSLFNGPSKSHLYDFSNKGTLSRHSPVISHPPENILPSIEVSNYHLCTRSMQVVWKQYLGKIDCG